MFNHKYRYLFIIVLSVYSYINTLFSEALHYYGITESHVFVLTSFLLICLLVWEGNRLLYFLLQRFFAGKQTRIHPLLVQFLLSHIIAFVSGFVCFYFLSSVILKEPFSSGNIALKLAIIFAFRVNVFLQAINTITYYLDKFQQKQLESEELKRISSQAELQAIKSQINPHFLFNNLNVLSSLVLQKNDEANKFIEEFSVVYRYILTNQDKELVPLLDEIEFIDPYLFLLKKRFPEGILVDINIPELYHSWLLVPVALQMLVENCIKHNIVSARRPLSIRISIAKGNVLTVTNNLQEKPDKAISGKSGLANISKRVEILTGKAVTIRQTLDEFSVSIPLIEPFEMRY
jgi:sensor histidine kinase YesM